MRNVPVVSHPVNACRFQVGSEWVLLLLSISVQVAWWTLNPDPGWAQASALLTCVLLACLVLYQNTHPVCGVLQWTGQAWLWESEHQGWEGRVVPRLDFQSRILLEFKAPGLRAIWLWLEAGDDVRRWESFRRALWSMVSDAGRSGSPHATAL